MTEEVTRDGLIAFAKGKGLHLQSGARLFGRLVYYVDSCEGIVHTGGYRYGNGLKTASINCASLRQHFLNVGYQAFLAVDQVGDRMVDLLQEYLQLTVNPDIAHA